MKKFKNIGLIVNIKSRRSRDFKKQIDDLCQKFDINVSRKHYITDHSSFSKAIKTEKKSKPDLLIIGGGDGTIHSIINQIDTKTTAIAILPLGTANNFAKSLGLNKSVKQAFKVIKAENTKKINLGDVNGHAFTNLAAIGLSTRVAQNVSDKTKRFIGRPAYYLQGIYEMIVHKPFLCEVNIDDGETTIFYTHQIVVANGQYHGPIRFTPGANIDSGSLTVIIFGRSKQRLVHLKNILYFIFPGWIKRVQPIAVRAEKISLHTNPSRAIEVDGEAVSQTPAEFSIRKNSLKVIYKPNQ